MGTVLVVDEDGEDLELITIAIESIGMVCLCFSTPKAALSYLGNERNNDILSIFIDAYMPDFNAKELVSLMRALPRIDDVPIAVFATPVRDEDRADYMNMGADYVFSKPNDLDQYKSMLKEVMSTIREKDPE